MKECTLTAQLTILHVGDNSEDFAKAHESKQRVSHCDRHIFEKVGAGGGWVAILIQMQVH